MFIAHEHNFLQQTRDCGVKPFHIPNKDCNNLRSKGNCLRIICVGDLMFDFCQKRLCRMCKISPSLLANSNLKGHCDGIMLSFHKHVFSVQQQS